MKHTETRNDPEDGRDKEISERPEHRDEELGIWVNGTPWFESLDEGFAFGQHNRRDVFHLSCSLDLFLTLVHAGQGRFCSWFRSLVGCFFDDEKCEDEQCRGEGALDVEEESP